MTTKVRYHFVDYMRGFTVFLMIIFHFAFDLNSFRFVQIDFSRDLFWWSFPRVIVFIFLIASGMSLTLAHHKQVKWPKFWKRWLKITIFALLISAATYFAFPHSWIYFGTLHCISAVSLIAIPFLKRPKLSILTSLIIILPYAFGYKWPFFKMSHQAMDYIPILPWFAVVTFGIFLFHKNLHKFDIGALPLKKTFLFLGRHSLVVYLTHQLILFPLVYLASLLR